MLSSRYTWLLVGLFLGLCLWAAPSSSEAQCMGGVCSCDGLGTDTADGDCLESALATAVGGDIIKLACGETYNGDFVAPVHSGGDHVTVTVADGCLASLPAAGARIHPVTHSAGLATLTSPDSDAIIGFATGASYWTFGPGLAITDSDGTTGNGNAPVQANGGITDVVSIYFDRVVLHNSLSVDLGTTHAATLKPLGGLPVISGVEDASVTRNHGFNINGTDWKITNSYIGVGHCVNDIGGGPGCPQIDGILFAVNDGLLIQNNHIEAVYSPLFSGGGGAAVDPNHTATVMASPAPTTTSARLTSCTDLDVNDAMAIKLAESPDHANLIWGAATVATINMSNCDVTWTRQNGSLPTAVIVTCDVLGNQSMGATSIPLDNCDYTGAHSPYTLYVNEGSWQKTWLEINGQDNYTSCASPDGDDKEIADGTYTFSGGSATITLESGIDAGLSDNDQVVINPCVGLQDFYKAPDVGATVNWEGYTAKNVDIIGNLLVMANDSLPNDTFVKGCTEFKQLETFTFIGNHCYSIRGHTIVLFAQNQDGSNPWVSTSNGTVRSNLFYRSGHCLWVTVRTINNWHAPSANITFENNGCIADDDDANASAFSFINSTGGQNFIFRYNTFTSAAGMAAGVRMDELNPVSDGWTVEFNIYNVGTSGHFCNQSPSSDWSNGSCKDAFDVFRGNLMLDDEGVGGGNYPTTDMTYPNIFTAKVRNQMGFRSLGTFDFRLTSESPGYQAGPNGRSYGADWNQIYAAMNPNDWPFEWTPGTTPINIR